MNIHQDINKNVQGTNDDLNSNFVVQPQSFQCLDNIYVTSNSKKDPYFQNLFNHKYPPIYTEGSLDNPMTIPEVNDQLMKKMKIDIKADNPKDYYHGIFGTQRQKLGSEYKTKFVMLFADTKSRYINQHKMIFHIIDCDKTTEWFSTHCPNPTITLYFPYHLLTLNHIALRTHMNQNFGGFFPKKFRIYGIDDDKNVICIGNYDSNKLNDYEVKTTFPLKSCQLLRAIHIVNDGKFGLSYLDLFGTGIFNESKTLFSENFLLSPTTYENIQIIPVIYDKQPSHKALKKKILSKFRKNEELDDSSPYLDIRTGPIRYVEALNLCKNSIIQKLIFNYNLHIGNDTEGSTEQFHLFSYNVLKFRLTGIEINSPEKDKKGPHGFNVYGHLNDPNSEIDEWRRIFSSKNELLSPDKDYIYPIDNPNEFTSFLFTSYGKEFDIGHVSFYGSAIIFKSQKKIPTNFQILFKEPPVGIFEDTSEPGIFETMQNYYGSMMNGFVSVITNRNNEQYELFRIEDITLTRIYKPYICIHFRQHQIKLTSIKICASNNYFKHFIIATTQKVIIEDDHLFEPNEEYILNVEDCDYTTCLIIYSFDLPYTIKKFEIYGYVKKGKEYNLKPVFPKAIMKVINGNKPITKDPKDMFQKEFMSAVITNPDIEFSGIKYAKQDILSIGLRMYRNFVSFYTFGTNGSSILTKNPDNYWVSTSNGNENSFTLLFNHHSVRLTSLLIHTPNPHFDKFMLQNFYIYGYNSHVKRYDCILSHESEKPLESMSTYNFPINQENQQIFYRMLTFISYSGRFAISYIKLFGDVIKEDDNPPNKKAEKNDYCIKYKAMPYIETFRS